MNTFLSQLVSRATDDRGLICGDPHDLTRISWHEIHQRARRVAGALRMRGVRRGDAVAMLAEAPADIVPVLQGIWIAGASATMLHQPLPRTDLTVWLSDTTRSLEVINARAVIVGAPFETAVPLLSGGPVLSIPVDDLWNADPADPVATVDEDIAFLQFTSGSTGRPKAVAISYRNMWANLHAMQSASAYHPERDVMINWLPLFHDMGMMGFIAVPMFHGGDVVCITPTDFMVDPLLWARMVSSYHGTMSAAPNFAYALLAKRLSRAGDGDYDLSSLRFALTGAEPIDVDVLEKFTCAGARFGLRAEALVPAYGMAEATLCVSMVHPGLGYTVDTVDRLKMQASHEATPSNADGARRYVPVGRPLNGFEVKIVTEGVAVGTRRVGEIHLRGDSVTSGYLTERGHVAARDAQGWLATGDLGYRTEDGELVVCGRSKDTIIVSGRNIYPVDIERAAARARHVRAGNAVAVRITADNGDSFAVLVESALAADDDESNRIKSDVAERVLVELGVTPRLVRVLPVGALPKTPSGKLRRAEAHRLLAEDIKPGPPRRRLGTATESQIAKESV